MAVSIFIFRTSFSSSSACKIKSKQTKITKKGKWFEFYKPLIIIFIFIFKFFEIQAMVKMAMMLHASVQPQGKPISRFNHCIKISRSPLENYGMWKLRNMKQMWREREESDTLNRVEFSILFHIWIQETRFQRICISPRVFRGLSLFRLLGK